MAKVLAAFLSLFLAAPLRATVWIYAPATVDEVVIDTTTPVRIPRFQRLWYSQTAPFRDFRYAHQSSDGAIAFIANDFRKYGYAPDDKHGVYRSWPDGRFETIATRGMSIPELGNALTDYFISLQSHEHTLTFYGRTQNSLPAFLGLYKGQLRTIAYKGQHTPLGTFTSVAYGTPHGRQAIFTASFRSPAASTSQTGAVVYDFDADLFTPLLTTESAPPGREHTHKLTWFNLTHTLKNGVAYVRGWLEPRDQSSDTMARFYDYYDALYKIVSERNDGLFRPGEFRVEKILDGLDDSSLARRSREHVLSLPPGAWTFDTIEHRKRTSIRMYTVAASDTVWAMVCQTADDACHILYNSPDGVATIVDSDTAIPDLFEGVFSEIESYLQVYDDIVYFQGGNDKFTGIFAYDTTLDRLYLVLDKSEQLEGKTIASIQMGFTSVYKNRMAFTATFTDGSAGVYLATLPEKYFIKKSKTPSPAK